MSALILRCAGFEFRPRILASLMTIAGCGLFLGLASWQIQRAQDKQVLQAEIEHRRQLPTLDWPDQAGAAQPYRKIRVRGHLLLAQEILLDNRVHGGQAGYHVITPLQIEGRRELLLVNRGWVGLGRDRAHPPQTPGPDAIVEVHGDLRRPAGKPLGLSAQAAADASTQRVWPYLDRQRLAAQLDRPVAEWVVYLDPAIEFGFVREWPRADFKVGMHVAYALQWLAFAVIAFSTYVYVSVTRRTGNS